MFLRRCLVTANNFRGQEIAEGIHRVGEGEEVQGGGGSLSKFHSKAMVFKKKNSIPEAAVFSLGADACGRSLACLLAGTIHALSYFVFVGSWVPQKLMKSH